MVDQVAVHLEVLVVEVLGWLVLLIMIVEWVHYVVIMYVIWVIAAVI